MCASEIEELKEHKVPPAYALADESPSAFTAVGMTDL